MRRVPGGHTSQIDLDCAESQYTHSTYPWKNGGILPFGFSSSLNYRKFVEIDQLIFESFRKIFVQGQADGSIRSDLDVDQFSCSTIYIAVGFFQLVSFTGDTYPKHFGYEKDSFIQFSIQRLLELIKAGDK